MIVPADLRLRLVAVLPVLLCLTGVQGIAPALAALLLAVSLFPATGQAVPWRRLWHLEGFLLLLFLTLPFTVQGHVVASLGPFHASAEGLLRALVLGVKVAASVLLIAALFGAVDPLQLGAALQALRLPAPLVRMFITLTRYLALFRAEAARLHDAMRARSFRPRSNRHTWRSYGYLLGMLLVRALDRAERVEQAMRLRNYAGRFPRLALAPPRAGDWLALAGWVAAAAGLLLWDRL